MVAPVPSSLVMQNALPTDVDLDDFESGDAEVDAFFRSRKWFNAEKGVCAPPTYVFRSTPSGPAIGYAAVAVRQVSDPDDSSSSTARYFTIYAVGINRRYQGERNPMAPGQTYAASILEAIEGIARETTKCKGVSLWVRAPNERAIRCYCKAGFVADPNGPKQRLEGPPHLTMRKTF